MRQKYQTQHSEFFKTSLQCNIKNSHRDVRALQTRPKAYVVRPSARTQLEALNLVDVLTIGGKLVSSTCQTMGLFATLSKNAGAVIQRTKANYSAQS